MSANTNLLYVPMEMKALVVNDQVRYAEPFQRWQMNYNQLAEYLSPMPAPFDGNTAAGWNDDPTANGVYLHWTLPDALRNGTQSAPGSPMQFPLTPNRWLVVRYNGPLTMRTATAWIVESDFLDPNEGTSPYLQPDASSPQPTSIGRMVPVASWSETGTQPLFLTAVGPGDISFAGFQKNVENVFSIHDPLTNVPVTDTLAYLVAGWYSDPSKDILSVNGLSFADALAALDWSVDSNLITADSILCHSMVHGIQWNSSGSAPVSAKPTDTTGVTMAVGNTSIDALTALINVQVNAQGKTASIDPSLLEAFQYNLLPQLNQPNGQFLVDQAIHKAWFGSTRGGYEWVVTQAAQGSTASQTSPIDDPALNPAWLQTLNQNQQAYDDALETLETLQWKLYSLWWTAGTFNRLPPQLQTILREYDADYTPENFTTQLDATQQNSLAAQVQQQQQLVAGLLAKIPYGETQAALTAAAAAYGMAQGMTDSYVLKRTARKTYFEGNNPVVLIAGAKTSGTLAAGAALACRSGSELVTGFSFNETSINAAALQSSIPNPGISNLPYDLSGLLVEFFLLDPDNATMIAAKALNATDPTTIQALATTISAHSSCTGIVPALDLTAWVQPWQPLYMLWEVQYYPIAHDTNGVENWQFDGDEYNWNGNGAAVAPLTFNGRLTLSPLAGFNFKKRIEDYISHHPNLDNTALQNLEALIGQTDNWDFLSQSLDGFSKQLALRDIQSNTVPNDAALAALIADQDAVLPVLGAAPVPFQGWAASDFQQYRSGQFAFNQVVLVDRFGQVLEIVTADTTLQYAPVIAPDMQPVHTVIPQDPYRFVELKPRLLQPGRLHFDFVSAADDTKIIQPGSSDNPVCAWVLTNHIDRALACYDNTGKMVGELGVVTNTAGAPALNWAPAPGSSYGSIAAVSAAFPHLGEMLNGLLTAGVQAFRNFYEAIDATLWTVDPQGNRDDQNLSVLVGRPLALVRCRLMYDLNGAPVADPSWQFVFNPQAPEFVNYNFPVRLGELAMRNDGLLGYFNGTDYTQFNCVYTPVDITPASPPYLDNIAPGNFINLQFGGQSAAFITLLMDPHSSVHATTSILPVESVSIPARFVDPVLSSMAVTFQAGPLLSKLSVSSDGKTASIVMPAPVENNGTWSWLTPVTNESYPLQQSDDKAHLPTGAPVLRSGMLQLGGLNAD